MHPPPTTAPSSDAARGSSRGASPAPPKAWLPPSTAMVDTTNQRSERFTRDLLARAREGLGRSLVCGASSPQHGGQAAGEDRVRGAEPLAHGHVGRVAISGDDD